MSSENVLYYGDNHKILEEYIDRESIDLIYLDPPFKSNQAYNILFAEQDGTQSQAQIKVFEDTWHWDEGASRAYQEIVAGGGKVADAMEAFFKLLGGNDMMAYLAMMAPRLVLLHQILKPTGSIYLHCDPTASHYLKILMDSIFSPIHFRNEITWRRTGAHNKLLRYAPIHDIIFFYTKSDSWTWNYPKRPYMRGHVENHCVQEEGKG